jgi:hypothetical protein
VTINNAVFWDVAPCRYFVNRRFGGTYGLHLPGIRNPQAMSQREKMAVLTHLLHILKILFSEGLFHLELMFLFFM